MAAELVGPRLYSCHNCRNHVALHDDIISKAFQVHHFNFLTIFCLICIPSFMMFILSDRSKILSLENLQLYNIGIELKILFCQEFCMC